VCLYVCMYVCMYVYIYIYIHTRIFMGERGSLVVKALDLSIDCLFAQYVV
jgi:cell division protein FtsL